MKNKNIAILGTVGIPANYGGFETLVENLIKHHAATSSGDKITVYCSSRSYPSRPAFFLSAHLRYVPLNANGAQSIPYDILSLMSALWRGNDEILLLGVSGAIALPLLRLFSSARIITNIDGIEWRRDKWRGWTKRFLRWSEKLAVRHSHEVIADNAAIATYVKDAYGVDCHVIAYGGDHAVNVEPISVDDFGLPVRYAFSVCRIEPENNIHIIVEAFSRQQDVPLVLVGNWNKSEYGRELRRRFAAFAHLHLLDPIYDLGKLRTLRANAFLYVHGHSAGGTNPSLVEAMHFGRPILAFDCVFNRATTEDKALFFLGTEGLQELVAGLNESIASQVGRDMQEIAQRRYTWEKVAQAYFKLLAS